MPRLLVLLIIIAGCSFVARPQTGSMVIGFRDPFCRSSAVKGVHVKVEGHAFSKTTKTDASGFFAVSKLSAGSYKMTTSKFGFKNYIVSDIEILEGIRFQHTYDLERGYASDAYDSTINNARYDPCKHEDKTSPR